MDGKDALAKPILMYEICSHKTRLILVRLRNKTVKAELTV